MDSYLKIFALFARSLSHKIRTPLSVISNELYCLGTKTSKEDVELALSQCKKISGILGSATALTAELSISDFPAKDLVDACGIDLTIRGDKEKLLFALSLLEETFGAPIAQKIASNGKSINLSYPLPSGISPNSSGICGALSELFLNHLDIDSIAPSLFDTIILGHGWTISSEISDGRLNLKLILPDDERCNPN